LQLQIHFIPLYGKVVIATNIAETSITIDDVVYVVDAGKSKEKTYDALNNLACLLPSWVSKASAHQRRVGCAYIPSSLLLRAIAFWSPHFSHVTQNTHFSHVICTSKHIQLMTQPGWSM
jgi:hypothetical protein